MNIQTGYHSTMRTRGRASQAPRPTRFSENELRAARAVAERLAVEVTRLLATVEPQHRNASALARRLEIDRTGLQRLISAVVNVDERTLSQAPGPKALRRIINAYANHQGDQSVVHGFEEAIQRLEAFLAEHGGHQRGYTERLLITLRAAETTSEDTDMPASASERDDVARRRMFDTARDLTGRWSDVQTQIVIMRPSLTEPRVCDVVRARGLIGHMQQAHAVALFFTHLFGATDGRRPPYESLRPRPAGELPSFLLDEFCSPNWRVSSMVEGDTLVQIAEPDQADLSTPADLVLASASFGMAPDPRIETPPTQEMWTAIEFPTRRLILDVYLHMELARRCMHGADAHALRVNDPGFPRQYHRRWMTRIGPPITLSILGTDLAASDSDAYARQRPLTEALFASVDWDPERFVGFRLDTEFPIWRTAVRAYFNFEQ